MPGNSQDKARKQTSNTPYKEIGNVSRDNQRKTIYTSLLSFLEHNHDSRTLGLWTDTLEEALYEAADSGVNKTYRTKAMQLVKNMQKAKGEGIEQAMKNLNTAFKSLLEFSEEPKKTTTTVPTNIHPPVMQRTVKPPIARPKIIVQQQVHTERTEVTTMTIADDINKDPVNEQKQEQFKEEVKEELKKEVKEKVKEEIEEEVKGEISVENVPQESVKPDVEEVKDNTKDEEIDDVKREQLIDDIKAPLEAEPKTEEPITIHENIEIQKETQIINELPTTEKKEEPKVKVEDNINLLEAPGSSRVEGPVFATHGIRSRSIQSPQEESRFTKDQSLLQLGDKNSLYTLYKQIRHELDAKKRKLHATNNQLNFCSFVLLSLDMTKGELLEKKAVKCKKEAEEAEKALSELKKKLNPKENIIEKCKVKKEEYENLVNELEELKDNYSDIKNEKKAQLSESKRLQSEYKFEVSLVIELVVREA